jgi:WD repeat-containing protein 23
MIMSAAWESAGGGSVVARHEWKGLSKFPGALEDWVAKRKEENLSGPRRVPGAFESSDED